MYTHMVEQPEVNENFMSTYDPIPKLASIPPFGPEWISLSTVRRRGNEIPFDQYDFPVYERIGLCRNEIGFVLPGTDGKIIKSSRTCNGSAKLIITNPRLFGFDVDESTRLTIGINPRFGVAGYRQGVIVRLGREFSFIEMNDVNFEFIEQCLCTCQIDERVFY